MKRYLLLILLSGLVTAVCAQDYNNHSQITQRARQLKSRYPDKVSLVSLGKSSQQRELWAITLGKGNTSEHPAIAIVAGVDGQHLLGVELAIGIAEKMLAQPAIEQILEKNTLYILPNVNPDATEQYFAPLRYERTLNGRATDNDRDWTLDEDPFEDLNNDGMISMMRVESPLGKYIESSSLPGLMLLADPSKGETGKYLLLSEGIDNDKDGQFNEDGPGGVNFNRNFTYMYRNFEPQSGEWAVSEVETKAVADFLYDAFNVHTVLTFGLNNNLSKAVKAFATGAQGPGRENVNDSKINVLANSLYNQYVPGMSKAYSLPPEGGEFYTWAYQHYGRYSFVTPGWSPVTDDREASGNPQYIFLKWAQENDVNDVFIPWRKVEHPDFPENLVEVGGIKPFVMYNPPYNMVEKILDEHVLFVKELIQAAPQISITSFKKESLDKGIHRITVTIRNNGAMPTINQIGERSYYLKYITLQLSPSKGQTLLQGNKKVIKPSLDGGETAQFSWLIQGNGKVTITAGCPTAGYSNAELNL